MRRCLISGAGLSSASSCEYALPCSTDQGRPSPASNNHSKPSNRSFLICINAQFLERNCLWFCKVQKVFVFVLAVTSVSKTDPLDLSEIKGIPKHLDNAILYFTGENHKVYVEKRKVTIHIISMPKKLSLWKSLGTCVLWTREKSSPNHWPHGPVWPRWPRPLNLTACLQTKIHDAIFALRKVSTNFGICL